MTNSIHANLTGTDLHEPKGIDAADEGTAYVADGAGSGAWTQLPFKGGFVHVREDANSGGNSVTTLGVRAWTTRKLVSTVHNDISATLSSYLLTLPAGTYYAIGSSTWLATENAANTAAATLNKLRLRNTTDSTTLLIGPNTYGAIFNCDLGGIQQNITPPSGSIVTLNGQFTLLASKAIALQHYFSGPADIGGGGAASSGEFEVYAELMIWKV